MSFSPKGLRIIVSSINEKQGKYQRPLVNAKDHSWKKMKLVFELKDLKNPGSILFSLLRRINFHLPAPQNHLPPYSCLILAPFPIHLLLCPRRPRSSPIPIRWEITFFYFLKPNSGARVRNGRGISISPGQQK